MASCTTLKNHNTGVPLCDNLAKEARRLILVPKYDDSGTLNEFANEAAVTKAVLQAKFGAVDVNDRFFPLPEMENVEDVRAEPNFHEWNSGNKVEMRKGSRHFKAIIPMEHFLLIQKIEAFKGTEFGIFAIDEDNNFIYNKDSETLTKVQPIMVDGKSLSVYAQKQGSEPNGVIVEFDFARSTDDAMLAYIPESLSTHDFDGLSTDDVYALTDLTTKRCTFTGSTTTGTLTVVSDYGNPITGLASADLEFTDTSDDSAVTITSVTEGADGVYAIVFATSEASNEIRVGDAGQSAGAKSTSNGLAKFNLNEYDGTAYTGGLTATISA